MSESVPFSPIIDEAMEKPAQISEVLIQRAIHIANDSDRVWSGNVQVPDLLRDLVAEIERLNKWADSFSEAQLKERALAEAVIRELRESRSVMLSALHFYADPVNYDVNAQGVYRIDLDCGKRARAALELVAAELAGITVKP